MFPNFNKLLINNICIEGVFQLMEDIFLLFNITIIYYSFKGNFLRHLIVMKTITITKQNELKGVLCVYILKNRERDK